MKCDCGKSVLFLINGVCKECSDDGLAVKAPKLSGLSKEERRIARLERDKIRKRKFYEKNRELVIERVKAYNKANPEKRKEWNRKASQKRLAKRKAERELDKQ